MRRIVLFTLLSALFISFQSCDKDEEEGTLPAPSLSIGDFHEGGIIFYIDDTGQHGFVCAASDQSFETTWGCPPAIINGANGLILGTGTQNTIDIINTCDDEGIAAELCDRLELNEFDDWFLPSKDELNTLYINREKVNITAVANGGNNLEDAEYWTSSHETGNTVIIQSFSAGNQSSDFEDSLYNVRAIRAF